jgi:hypothetical protein
MRAAAGGNTLLYFAYFSFYLPAGILLSGFAPYLQSKGLSLPEVGSLFGFLFMVKLFIGPLITLAVEHAGKSRLTPFLFLFAATVASVMIAFHRHFIPLAVSVIVLAICRNYYQAILELQAICGGNRGQNLPYGRLRLFGSVAVAAGVALFGMVQACMPAMSQGVFACILVASAGIFMLAVLADTGLSGFSTLLVKRGGAGGEKRPFPVADKAGLALLLLTATLLVGAHGTLYGVASLSLAKQGWSAAAITAGWVVAFLAEAAAFYWLGRIRSLLGAGVVIAGAAAAAMRWLIFAASDSMPLLFLAFALHAFSFALIHGCLVAAVRDSFPERYATTGQSIYFAFAHGIGMATASFFGLSLYAVIGRSAFMLPLAMTLSGAAAWLFLARRIPSSTETRSEHAD